MRQLRTLTAVATATAAAAMGCGGTVQNDIHPRAAALRAMTFNIQSGHRGLEGIAEVIRAAAPDLVALQEVDRFSRRAAGLDQAAELSRLTGLPYHHHFRTTDYFGGEYGIGLLSRLALEDLRQVPLPVADGEEPRTAGLARIELGGSGVTILVTHLSHLPINASLRLVQTRKILDVLSHIPGPKVVLGDLNDGATSPAVQTLRGALADAFDSSGEGPDGTYPLPLFLPALRLDYVFASRELAPVHSFVVHSEASDHYPIVAEFNLAPEAP